MPTRPPHSRSLAIDPRLQQAARLPSLTKHAASPISLIEAAILFLAGSAASALTNLLRLHLGVPGSSIVYAAFPLALGFALVPRRGAGSVMTAAALLANVAFALAGARLDGVGAQTSLLLTGPLLDLALRRSAGGWRLYAAFIAACTGSNAAAFVVRAMARAAGLHGTGMGGGTLATWWPHAIWTYAAAGLLAGLISVAAWFQLRPAR